MKFKVILAVLFVTFIATWNVPKHTDEPTQTQGEPFTAEQIAMYESEIIWEDETTTLVMEHKHAEPEAVVLDIPLSADLQKWCQEKCRQYGVSYSFFLAICESESTFGLNKVGDSGKSIGLMQIRQCNWNRYDGLDVNDDYDNAEIGIRMLGELVQKYQEADQVIMAYKGGETAMQGWVAEGYKLDCCDILTDRMMYWQERIASNE